MTPPQQLCVLCAPAFALAAAMVCSCKRSTIGWVCCFLSDNPVAPWSRFTVAWDHVILGGHIVYHTSPFCFSMRSYPPELQRQSTTLGPTNEGGGGEATISHPQCAMGLLALLLGWLAHCVISLVVPHMTSWRSMDFPMRLCMKVYGRSLRLLIHSMSLILNIQHLR